jgi:membrane-bound lytic murein transglycosylase MltF
MKPIKIVSPSPYLETEDFLELVNAGIFDLTVADRHIAELWSSVLTDMVPRYNLKVHAGGKIAWAVRKNSPELLASLNPFVKKNKKRTLIGNILFKKYYENAKWIRNPLTAEEQKKLERYRDLFQKYADKYDFDWLLLAAQSYQESRLDHSTVSRAGAVGLMQIMPVVSQDMNIPNIRNEDNNIHAGTKYMAYLRKHFFNDSEISKEAKRDFTLAGYNAGPNRVKRWRKEAANVGLDPNKWFFNVERIALQQIGQETVQYVGNINKYYLAYKSAYRIQQEKSKQNLEKNK